MHWKSVDGIWVRIVTILMDDRLRFLIIFGEINNSQICFLLIEFKFTTLNRVKNFEFYSEFCYTTFPAGLVPLYGIVSLYTYLLYNTHTSECLVWMCVWILRILQLFYTKCIKVKVLTIKNNKKLMICINIKRQI